MKLLNEVSGFYRRLYVYVIVIVATIESSQSNGSGKLELSDILPANQHEYDKMRPPKKDGKATIVDFHVTVMSIDSIDEGKMTFMTDIFFGQTWRDHRLQLPANMTNEYRLLEVQWLNQLWSPDSFFKNAKRVTFHTMSIPNHYLWLYRSKSILYMVKLTLILSCSMNFAKYPHDTQICSMKIESLSHTTDDLVFQWQSVDPLVVDQGIELPQLSLVKTTLADCTQMYSTGNFTCLEVIFKLKRRLGYYMFQTYFPTCMIVIMSWVSFWIKPEAVPARITLGVTSLLTMSTQHAKSQASLPPVSYIKAIDIFMSACIVFVFLSLMEYALVNNLLGDSQREPTYDKKSLINGSIRRGQIVDLSQKEASLLKSRKAKFDERVMTDSERRRHRAIIVDKFSRIFFPLSFVVLNLIYWIVFSISD
ncbi:ort (predicted) [Pycnogonum litorale]